MPIHKTASGKWEWGSHGAEYSSRAGAERQAAAAYAHGYRGDEQAPDVTAAGIALRSPDGKLLFMKRSDTASDHPGEWSFPGGHMEANESPIDAAKRELYEETGLHPPTDLDVVDCRAGFTTFSADVPEFTPVMNAEHTEFRWAKPDEAPQPLHPGVVATLAMGDAASEQFSRKVGELVRRGYAPKQAVAITYAEQRSGGIHDRKTVDHAGYYAPESIGKTRRITPEGFLVCEGVPIARTGEQLYGAHELEGLDANGAGIIVVQRPEDEVFRDETLASFEGKPITLNHPPKGVEPSSWKELAIGHVQNVRRGEGLETDFIVADLLIQEADAIAYVNRNLPDISSGYDASYEQLEPGKATQRNIIGNHVAVLAGGRGRAGSRVSFRDSLTEENPMATPERSFWRVLRARLESLGVKTTDAESLQQRLEEHMTHDEDPEEKRHKEVMDALGVVKAMDERLQKVEDRWSARDAEEEKEKERKEAADKAARDAAEETRRAAETAEATGDTILSAESPGHVLNMGKTWTGGMTGDAATQESVLQGLVSRAEILAPGIPKPTADSIKGNQGKVLAAFMRTVLERHMTADAAGAETVNTFLMGRKVAELSGENLVGVYNGSAQLARSRNNRASQRVVMRDARPGSFGKTVTVDSINEQNKKFWAERGVKQ